MESELSRLKSYLARSSNGTAVLFTGAGFSYGSTNLHGRSPKDSRALSRAICDLCSIDQDEDLYYSSEYCIDKHPIHDLVKLLREEFTIKTVSESHKNIALRNWRRIYTTNYDRVYEIASNLCGKDCESVTTSASPSKFSQRNQCVHLNGSIEDLEEDALTSEFKLSDSSYVSPETLNSSRWKSTLQVDVEFASAVFFVGYSMYDLDIKRIVRNDIDIKDKTFFIVKPGEEEKEKFKLSKYGTVLDIGVDEFSNIVSETMGIEIKLEPEDLECFEKLSPTESEESLDDRQIIDLFIKGELIETYLFESVTKGNNYLVKRIDVQKNAELVLSGKNLLIIGDIACGKTIYSKQVASILTHQGRDVYYLSNEDGDYQRDISIISETSKSPIFFVDNAFRHEDTIKNMHSFFGGRATFVIAGRTDFIERTKIKLAELDLKFIEEEFDFLSPVEISELNKICNHIGFWGERNSWSTERKESYLAKDCEGRFSTILLKFFDSEYVKKIYEDVFSKLKNKKSRDRDLIFIVVLLGILPFSPTKSCLSDLCGNDRIHDPDFYRSPLARQLLSIRKRHVEITSGILSKYILGKYFSGREVVDKVLDIIGYFNSIKSHSDLNNSVFKELLRFKNINFMLPDENRGNNLITFFNRLKSVIGWMERSPHFWLQYGMANMFIKDYPIAKQYFDNAYGSSKNDPNYDTKYIDNQMARWHLEYGMTKTDSKESYEHFSSACRLLASQNVDYYFCKQAKLIEQYYFNVYSSFSRKHKTEFEKLCKNILKRFETQKRFIESHNGAYVDECESMIAAVLQGIKLGRGNS
jgi:hypothetical protein